MLRGSRTDSRSIDGSKIVHHGRRFIFNESAFVSLCYREGMRNGKVTVNPAGLVEHRNENIGRVRLLSCDEYDQLCKVISERFTEHLAEFIVSVHTGMRLTEQYTTEWSQVHLDRRTRSEEHTS